MTVDRKALEALDRLSQRVEDSVEAVKARGRKRKLTPADVRELHVALIYEVANLEMVILRREQQSTK